MNNEQEERLIEALEYIARKKDIGDYIDHVFGPCKEDFSVAGGLRQIAYALEQCAEALRDLNSSEEDG